MSLDSRDYMRPGGDQYGGASGGGGGGRIKISWPRPGKAVAALLVANFAVFIMQVFFDQPDGGPRGKLTDTFGVNALHWQQAWRYITFQFLHSGLWHIFFNMLAVYMLGTMVEKRFGSKRFLIFYLYCGVIAGIAYVIVGAWGGVPASKPIIGASGGVFGILLACAAMFPNMRVLVFFIPAKIRTVALVVFAVMIYLVISRFAEGKVGDAMSDVAHLGGGIAAVIWVWLIPRAGRMAGRASEKSRQREWQKIASRKRKLQAEVDRVLDKVHEDGIASLTDNEKETLADATRRQREEERDIFI